MAAGVSSDPARVTSGKDFQSLESAVGQPHGGALTGGAGDLLAASPYHGGLCCAKDGSLVKFLQGGAMGGGHSFRGAHRDLRWWQTLC
jgi:hypothetical protein